MKRSMVIGILSLIGLGVVYLASCAEPLDVTSSPNNNPPVRVDTVFVFDTLTPSDTSLRIDTIRVHDTVHLTDTIHRQDTIRQIDTTVRFDTIRIIDPRYIYDTVTLVDTVKMTETTTVVDTLMRSDTIVQYDTVNVISHDTVNIVHYDTVTVTQTIIQHDTILVNDTIFRIDTITVVDTIVRVDTVTIGDPVDCNPEPFCGKLSSCDKDLIWLFRNAAGTYRLEFSGFAEKDQPLQTIVLNINGVDYNWQAATNPLWIKELTLPANTTIKIGLTKPPAYGHAISICLQMTRI